VLADITLYWPPGNTTVPLHVRKAAWLMRAGSALETAYGASNLQVVTPTWAPRTPWTRRAGD